MSFHASDPKAPNVSHVMIAWCRSDRSFLIATTAKMQWIPRAQHATLLAVSPTSNLMWVEQPPVDFGCWLEIQGRGTCTRTTVLSTVRRFHHYLVTTGGSYGQEKVSQLSTCPRQPSCHAPSMPSRAAQRILAQQQSQRRARVLLAGFLGLATSYAAVAAYTLRLRTIDDTPELKAAKEKIKLARQEARQQQQQ
jgi:hypothetical protein